MAQKPSYDQLTQRIQELEQELERLRAVRPNSQNDFPVRHRPQQKAVALESDERFREIADYSQKVFWLFDLKSQKVIYANSAFERIWGHPVKALYNHYKRSYFLVCGTAVSIR